MTYVNSKIYIGRPAVDVFDFISDPANNPQWQDGMQSCEVISGGEWGLGGRYSQKAKFLGREIVSEFEITEFEQGRLIRGDTVSSSFPISFTRIVEPDESGEGCHVQAIVTGDSSGFFKLFAPLMNWMVSRSIKRDYQQLKTLLESS